MLAQEVVAAVVPSRDIVFVEAAWDALLRSACCNTLCVWRLRHQLVDLGDLVFFFQSLR